MPGANRNRGKRRDRIAGAVVDMLIAMKAADRTMRDLEDLTDMVPETILSWLHALEQSGLVVEGARTKPAGQKGVAPKSWRML